jgi:hypothetical protein
MSFSGNRATNFRHHAPSLGPANPLGRKRNCAAHRRQGSLSQATPQAVLFIDMDAGAKW